MLFDPKWEKQAETKADPFALATLIAWLEKQPPEKDYDYCSAADCLIAQYLRQSGIAHYELDSGEVDQLGWSDIVHPNCFEDEWTFGAALKRARALVQR